MISNREQRSKNMRAVKSSGSKIERRLALALWERGHRYRKNDKSVYGKPDLTFKGLKIAIFVDSEFWHGKDWESTKYNIKSNIEFWHKKIKRNIERDKEVNRYLEQNGWCVLRFWGKEINKDLLHCVSKVEDKINEARRNNNT
ncbi:very short patch repair endonuclease [Salinimicrobium xinjiangense]|uniref:very short patch repair endonuclease n=1 Tax=Salinimicrobium xinjiangense TaxID=438596 RepID=UPI00048E8BC4|nr:very short patch repair endonuclease [Salinimicrobium xinjiangense]